MALFVPDRVQAPAVEVVSTEKATGLPETPPVADKLALAPTVPGPVNAMVCGVSGTIVRCQ